MLTYCIEIFLRRFPRVVPQHLEPNVFKLNRLRFQVHQQQTLQLHFCSFQLILKITNKIVPLSQVSLLGEGFKTR